MRIFKYWVEHTKTLVIDDLRQPSKIYGGSNISESEAIKDAERKFQNAQKKINNQLGRDDSYEVDIREEIIEEIDSENIVTRNRYGALVLNSKNMMFIDIDEYTRSIWDMLFNRSKTQKEFMLAHIEKTTQRIEYADFAFNIYETHKGYRVLVTNQTIDPRSEKSRKMMKAFHADRLYRYLCVYQNCYRARLTPKPHRIKQKRIHVIFPNRNAEGQMKLDNWIRSYDERSKTFSTCRFIKSIGNASLNNKIIKFHDDRCNIHKSYPLA